ncbi:unnamed protein product [Vicia faba]|uniref:Uncharacterized protein n=1 Tax=Vicia faba TaxID=3906 RepID=A0AAV1A947_VICFA|nr:unnamed protein product [Vicia faba]
MVQGQVVIDSAEVVEIDAKLVAGDVDDTYATPIFDEMADEVAETNILIVDEVATPDLIAIIDEATADKEVIAPALTNDSRHY